MGTGTGLRWFLCPRQEKKRWGGGGGSKGGTTCTGGYKGVRAVRPESVAGGGWFEVLWNVECPLRIKPKRNMCTFPVSSKGLFICINTLTGWEYMITFATTELVKQWLEREIAKL